MSFHRYVALGDSFTEGVGDADVDAPNGWLGWADRVAGALATQSPDFAYANLAIRGRKLPQILAEQIEPALALKPDLVTLAGGANDILRPRVDIDSLAAGLEGAVSHLSAAGAHVVLFTIADLGKSPTLRLLRGRAAIFNEFLREIADRHGATIIDVWRWEAWDPTSHFDVDRLHLNSVGHQSVAMAVLDALDVCHDLQPLPIAAAAQLTRREQRAADLAWARTHLAPWLGRRLTGRSSGDGVNPKYPVLTPLG